MAVSPSHRLNHPKMPVFFEPKCSSPSEYYHHIVDRGGEEMLIPVKKRTHEHAQASAAQRLRNSAKSPVAATRSKKSV